MQTRVLRLSGAGVGVLWATHDPGHALECATRYAAYELGPKGIRVNAIAPGIVKTQFARALWEPDEDAAASIAPLQRLGVPVDVAHAALYLASDASAWVTGSVLSVDGGTLLRG